MFTVKLPSVRADDITVNNSGGSVKLKLNVLNKTSQRYKNALTKMAEFPQSRGTEAYFRTLENLNAADEAMYRIVRGLKAVSQNYKDAGNILTGKTWIDDVDDSDPLIKAALEINYVVRKTVGNDAATDRMKLRAKQVAAVLDDTCERIGTGIARNEKRMLGMRKKADLLRLENEVAGLKCDLFDHQTYDHHGMSPDKRMTTVKAAVTASREKFLANDKGLDDE